ncbi:MAG: copper ion binding protein, partial [Halobacteriaceae archaeon]
MGTQTVHLDITGMSCANCSATIQDTLESRDGVAEATANFATDEGSVTYDPERVTLREIYDAIEDAGYGAVSETTAIGITDMSCANCAETNESALEDLPGVIDAEVNYATDEAQVTYNPAETSPADLYDVIEEAGYSPLRDRTDGEDTSDDDAQEAARQAEIRHQLRLTLFGAALSAPLLFMLVEKYFLGAGLVPETVFGVSVGWVAFLLATPVQAVLGKQFYENSYKALVKNGR